MTDLTQVIVEDARLVILKGLAEEVDGRLNSDILRQKLRTFGITKERVWVHDQIRWLEGMGAVRVAEAGTVLVAEITQRGQSHVDRETAIEGVKRPGRVA